MKPFRPGIIALAVVLILIPLVIRVWHGDPIMPGGEGYGYLRMAESFAVDGFTDYDPAMPERRYSATIYDILLTGFVKLFGSGALLLQILLAIGTILCMLGIVNRSKIPSSVAIAAQLVFVLSPWFVDTFVKFTPRALELFLILFYLYVLLASENRSSVQKVLFGIGALVIAAVLATLGMIPAIIAVGLPFAVRTVRKKVPQIMLLASLAAFIVLVAFTLPNFLQTESPVFAKPTPVIHSVTDFGGQGMSLFAWLLAFIGLILRWHLKKRYYTAVITATLAMVAAFFLPSALVVAHIAIAFFAGYALAFFATREWSFDDIRVLTVVVLLCGLLFSTLTHSMELANGLPNKEIRASAVSFAEAVPQDTLLLTLPEDGFWFAYWSGQRVYLDGWLAQTPDVNRRWATAQAIWHSRELTDARPLLYRTGIGAVVITKDMREGDVWDVPEQDMLFLLRNSETFKNAYRSSFVDIWVILPE